jgi:DNA-binding MarR family transcriptional regulator
MFALSGDTHVAEGRLGFVIKVAQHALRTRLDEELRGMGLSTAKYSALSALMNAGEMSAADLARLGFVRPQTMGDIVKALERDGLLERRRHPVHGRIQLVCLSERGREVATQADERVKAIESELSAPLSDDERAATIDALRRCTHALRTHSRA